MTNKIIKAEFNLFLIILLNKGVLNISECKVSLDGINPNTEEKVPCLIGHSKTCICARFCTFVGDSTREVITAGILLINPKDVTIKSCTIEHHKGGGILMSLTPESAVEISENTLRVCEASAIYIQGEDSCPSIEKNKIRLCTSPGIKVGAGVNATIFENELKSDFIGIVVIDNKSKIVKNKIEKSHDNGIKIICNGKGKICNPEITQNQIIASKYNGIIFSANILNKNTIILASI